MKATQPRRMDWPERLAIIAFVSAAAHLVFGNVVSAIMFALCGLMGCTRAFEQVRAQGKPAPSDKGRLGAAIIFAVLGTTLLPRVENAPAVPAKLEKLAQQANTCPAEAQVTAVDFAVANDGTLREEPDDRAAAVQMAIGNETVDAPLETGATVRQLCRAGDWSKVHVLTAPKEFQPLEGWVPASSLRKVSLTEQGRRIYEAGDFDWPAGSEATRSALLVVMNRILQDDPACEALDTENLVAGKRGNETVYSIPCWVEGDLRSFEFTAADATNSRSFTPVDPISKIDAVEACKSAILSRASHPSTVDFPTFDYDQRDGGDGRTQLLMSFRAKNSFGAELAYDAQCEFSGTTVEGVRISEAAGG